MILTLRKIQHRGAWRIGISFPYSIEVNQEMKSLGAVYSSTLRCWYLDYNSTNYQLLKSKFTDISIENPKPVVATAGLVAGSESRDLPPIVAVENSVLPATKLPEKANDKPLKGHKAEIDSLAKKLHLQLFETIGKYWIFGMNYHYALSKELLGVKGIYWSKNQKVYMVLRNRVVKEKAEKILMVSGFFPSDYIEKEQPVKGDTVLIVKPHLEDNRWMQVFVPPVFMLREKIKRFSMSRYSVPHGCYLLPAAPEVYKALTVHYEPEKVVFRNQLPVGYLLKEKMPNNKHFLLQKAKNQVIEKTPGPGRAFIVAMMDAMLANNLSDATIKNYGNAFCRFLRDHDYRDPASLEYRQVVKYLGRLMEKGLSSTTGNMLVNALNYYYRHVENNRNFEFKLPRPKKEQKIRTVFTMEECACIFGNVENPKHKLALMIAYGAGLRVSEVVTLKWADILMAEQKIHVHPVGLNYN